VMDGSELIQQERHHQIHYEGWTEEHDDHHCDGSLVWAAICYAAPQVVLREERLIGVTLFSDVWPSSWATTWDKRRRLSGQVVNNEELPMDERIRNLVKAGALIAAEVDRLRRLMTKEYSPNLKGGPQ